MADLSVHFAAAPAPGPKIYKNVTKSFTLASRILHGISLNISGKAPWRMDRVGPGQALVGSGQARAKSRAGPGPGPIKHTPLARFVRLHVDGGILRLTFT